MEQDQVAAIENARKEATLVGERLAGDAGVELVDVVSSTIVYRRNGHMFHAVVYDMTSYKP